MQCLITPTAARTFSAAHACTCFNRIDRVSVWGGMNSSLLLHRPGGAHLPS